MNRWDEFSIQEMNDLHFALRVQETHPIPLPPEEQQNLKVLADELWRELCVRFDEQRRAEAAAN